MPDILLLMILIYQRTLQAAAGVMFCGYSFYFSPDRIANLTVYVSQCQGSAYLITLSCILESHRMVSRIFTEKNFFQLKHPVMTLLGKQRHACIETSNK